MTSPNLHSIYPEIPGTNCRVQDQRTDLQSTQIQLVDYFKQGQYCNMVVPFVANPAKESTQREQERARRKAEKMAERLKMKQLVDESLMQKVNAQPWNPSQYIQSRTQPSSAGPDNQRSQSQLDASI